MDYVLMEESFRLFLCELKGKRQARFKGMYDKDFHGCATYLLDLRPTHTLYLYLRFANSHNERLD